MVFAPADRWRGGGVRRRLLLRFVLAVIYGSGVLVDHVCMAWGLGLWRGETESHL